MEALLYTARAMVETNPQDSSFGISGPFCAGADITGAFAKASRALEMRKACLACSREPGKAYVGLDHTDYMINAFLELHKRDGHPKFDTVAGAASRAFRERYLQYTHEVIAYAKQGVEKQVATVWALEYWGDGAGFVAGLRAATDSPHEYLLEIIPIATLLVEKSPAAVDLDKDQLLLDKVQTAIRWTYGNFHTEILVGLAKEDRALMDAFYAKLEENHLPGVAILAIHARLNVNYASEFSGANHFKQFQRMLSLADKALEGPSINAAAIDHHRAIIYHELAATLFDGPFPEPSQELPTCDECATLMLRRRELQPDLLESILRRYASTAGNKPLPSASIQAITKLVALAQDPDTNFPWSNRAAIKRIIDDVGSTNTLPCLASLPPLTLQLSPIFTNGSYITKIITDTAQDLAYIVVVTQIANATEKEGKTFTLQAIQVSLSKGTPIPLALMKLPFSSELTSFPVDIALDDHAVYVACPENGVVIFPRDGTPATILTTTQGLPSNKVQAVAALDGKLYIGYGVIYVARGESGYFAVYDLKTKQTTLLASSPRKEKLSPFDDSHSFDVLLLAADPKKHRILAYIAHYGDQGVCDPLTGLWQFDPATATFKLLVRFDNSFNPQWADKPALDAPLLFGSPFDAISFDRETDKASTLYDVEGISPIFGQRKTEHPLFAGASLCGQPYACINGEFWTGRYFIRAITPNDQHQRIIAVPGHEFFRCTYLQLLHDGKDILLGNQGGLWITPTPKHISMQKD